jgi:mannose-6-phosphate isomerase-like protein (cupin superfamily)
MKQPFVLTLPNDGSGYRSIVKPPRAVTMRSGLVRLEPGRDVGLHSTEGNEEILVVLEGQGSVELEGIGQAKISGGQVAYVPPRTRHNVLNTGTDPLRYIYVISRAPED